MEKNQLYRFSSSNSYGGGGAAEANLSSGGGSGSMYISRSLAPESFTSADLPSFLGSSRYLGYSSDPFSSSRLFSREDGYLATAAVNRIPGGVAVGSSPVTSRWSGPPGVEPSSSSADDLLYNPGYKRPTSEALYHQNVMGAHNTIGQTEAWFSTNPLAKRPRFESASNLPIYPQRPGEKDCSYYMLTRTCKFGDSCKFDHPIWVPEGGIPDWKEVPMITDGDYLPERPGDPDCPYFLKTQRCKFGSRCKFNHPKDKMPPLGSLESVDVAILPERPSEPPCAFYMKSGKCKYGASCKFHHPKDLQITLIQQENNNIEDPRSDDNETHNDLKTVTPSIFPAVMHNSKGLPVRQGEVDCPFYLKTGSCKYGPSCRYNHPERNAINPPAVIIGSTLVASPERHLNAGIVNPAASVLQSFDLRLTHQPLQLGLATKIYPQRPGETECDFYMKTGHCKFGQICKFHHPIDRSAPTGLTKEAQLQSVKLTLAGLPRREGAVHCPYYMKTGTCKYGATCKFDHPPPAEVMALAIGSSGGQGKEEQNVAESSEEH